MSRPLHIPDSNLLLLFLFIFFVDEVPVTGFANTEQAVVGAMMKLLFEREPQQAPLTKYILDFLHLLQPADFLDAEWLLAHRVVVETLQDARVQIAQIVLSELLDQLFFFPLFPEFVDEPN